MIKKLFHSPIFNSWFNAVIGLVSSVIAIPIVLTSLTVEEINVWFLFSSILMISQGVQFGFSSTFPRFIAYSYSGVKINEFVNIRNKKNLSNSKSINRSEFARIFYFMKYIYFFLSIVYILVLLGIGYIALPGPIMSLTIPYDGWLAFGIVVITSTISLWYGYNQNFLIGVNKVALMQKISSLIDLIGLVFILIVLYSYPTLVSIVLVYNLVALCKIFTLLYFGRNFFNSMSIGSSKVFFDKELFAIVWDSTWKSGITNIIANVVKHISAILVAQFFPTSASASFLFTKRIFDIIETFSMTAFIARVPVIAKYRGQGDFKKLMPLLRQTQSICYLVYLFGYVMLLFFGELVISHLGANVSLGSYLLIISFSFATFFSRWAGMTAMISNLSNHVVDYINLSVAAPVYLISAYLLYEIIGINAFPVAMFLGYFIASPTLIFTVYKTIYMTFWQYEKKIFFPYLGGLLIINLVYYFFNA
jgi:hypothetical protein